MKSKKRIIVAGAPRCGTTSLFNYLNDHPDVYGPEIKETCYLIDQGYFPDSYNQMQVLPNIHKNGLDGYDALFDEAKDNQVWLEATPDYMYQQTFLEVIGQFDPKPLVVFCLREPSARVYSLFKFAKSRLGILSNDITFSQFLDDIKKGTGELQEHNILKHVIDHSKYVNYVEKVAQVIGKENVMVVVNEEFIKAPVLTVSEIVDRMGLDKGFYDTYEFQRYNESYEVKTQVFRKIYEKLPLPYSWRYGDNPIKRTLKKIHHSINAKENSAKTDDESSLLVELRKEFIEPNARLKEQFQLDLSKWEPTSVPS